MRVRTAAVCLLVLVVMAGAAGAQTTVSPVDSKMIVRNSTTTYIVSSVYYVADIPMFELRVFFEFDLSAYGAAGTALFNFSGYVVPGYSTGTLYLRPMTGGEDGSVTTGDWSLLGSPIWSGIISGTYSSPQSFSVPVTSWFNARAGGFGGFALTSASGAAAFINAPGASLDYTAVPEPGTIALFGFGLVSLVIGHRVRRRRRQ